MEYEITEREGTVIVGFSGDVDLQSSPEARKILLECVARKMPVLVDLSKVDYIDSSGIASLVEALQTARKGGGNLFIVSASEAALKVLELARLDKVFTICNTIDDAIEQTG
jgi:anti-sigma B factor antagonist